MNKVIGFIKGNLVVVISVVLILAFLPTGYVFSSKWNKKVYENANAAYTKEKRTLTTKGTITYSLPAVLEGEEDLSESRAPNNAVTEFYKKARAERERQVQDVVDRGTAFNQGDHVEIVPGLLPKAPDDRTLVRLGREMAEAIAGTVTSPSVYQRKLQRLNAGMPPSAEVLGASLTEAKKQGQQRFESSNADGKMTAEQTEQLNKDMIARRLGEYIGRSKALTFYCSTDAFMSAESTGTSRGGSRGSTEYSVIPSTVPPLSTINESTVFTWLWDYWVVSDVLDAAAMSNRNPLTGDMAIPDAPVKRVEQIRISAVPVATAAVVTDPDDMGGGRQPRGGNTPAPAAEAQGTFTGRVGGVAGSPFDIRMVEVVVVGSSQDLPAFIDAIGKTNYMTVTDVDLEEVDVWNDLEQGFYYGGEHVVRASIKIESVWLRSWVSPLMPDSVKTALGIPVVTGNPESDG